MGAIQRLACRGRGARASQPRRRDDGRGGEAEQAADDQNTKIAPTL
jgi:hypothetical protein